MTKILLTDTKQQKKFLELPFDEQMKRGVLLDINDNRTKSDEEDVFFLKEYDVKRKPFLDYFGEYCKDGRKTLQKNLDDQEGEFELEDLCKYTPNIEDDPFAYFTIKTDKRYADYKKDQTKDSDIRYTVLFDYPLAFNHQEPQKNKPHEWIQFIRDLSFIEDQLEIKKNPFLKEEKLYRTKYKKWNDNRYKGIQSKEPETRLVPKALLNQTISPESPDPDLDNEDIFIGFLEKDYDKDYFVKQKLKY